LTFFFFFLFMFLCYTLTIVMSRQSSLVDTCYGIAHTDWSWPNTQPGICPVGPEKHVKTLDRLIGTISDNHVPPECSSIMEMRINTHCKTRQCCSHTSRIRLDLARTYKLQITRHRPRPLSYWARFEIGFGVKFTLKRL
jgi:hypothetical protein